MHCLMFLMCLCDPFHLVCSSPFPLLMGLFGLSPCQESAPHLHLAFAGSWKPPQSADKAVICWHVCSMG